MAITNFKSIDIKGFKLYNLIRILFFVKKKFQAVFGILAWILLFLED